jgi:hypothetical protein
VVARAAVPILRLLEDRPPELMLALLPSLVRVMLQAFLEVMRSRGDQGPIGPRTREAGSDHLHCHRLSAGERSKHGPTR